MQTHENIILHIWNMRLQLVLDREIASSQNKGIVGIELNP